MIVSVLLVNFVVELYLIIALNFYVFRDSIINNNSVFLDKNENGIFVVEYDNKVNGWVFSKKKKEYIFYIDALFSLEYFGI